jgi:hypothetical protein
MQNSNLLCGTYIRQTRSVTARHEMMLLRMVQRKQPDQKTRLFIRNQQRKQVLFRLELQANISRGDSLAHGVKISLNISQNMRLSLNLQSIPSKRPPASH